METQIEGIAATATDEAVVVTSTRPLIALSSALIGGGMTAPRSILNLHVQKGYVGMTPDLDLISYAERRGLSAPTVGMMTAARTATPGWHVERRQGVTACAIVTAGLSNAISAGLSEPEDGAVAGTINTIVLLDGALSDGALVNAALTATEAKTRTLGELNAVTPEGYVATGTSTDALVIACTGRGPTLPFAGPATEAGYAIARAVSIALTAALNGLPK